jgi:cytoskeletal protein CcmA (bactofilin family)
MLSGFKGKVPERDQNAAAAGPPSFLTAGAPPQRLPVEPLPVRPELRPAPAPKPEPATRPELTARPAAKPETIPSIGSNMSIAGQVVCTGQARVFGRVEGELRVSDLLLGEGAQVAGNVVAQEVTVRGHVKGTIRAVRVRLEDGATVEGDIFHRSLSIEEGALFEGSSRRVENPTDAPASVPETIAEPRTQAAQPQVAEPQVAEPHAASVVTGFSAEPTAEMARN